jgi:nicotinamide riboside kinase
VEGYDVAAPTYEELLDALLTRNRDLEWAQQRITSLRLEAAMRTSFVAELQNALDAANARIRQLEHDLEQAVLDKAAAVYDYVRREAEAREGVQSQIVRYLSVGSPDPETG